MNHLGGSSGAALLMERGAESGLGERTVTAMVRGGRLLWTASSCWGPLGDSPEQALGCFSPEAAKLRCLLLHSSLMGQGQSWGHHSLSLCCHIREPPVGMWPENALIHRVTSARSQTVCVYSRVASAGGDGQGSRCTCDHS